MIKLIALDVDGTLTDGKICVGNLEYETKNFSVKDGLGIVGAMQNGIKIAIITGKKSEIVRKRCNELGIEEVHQKIHNKIEKLKELCVKYGIESSEVAYMGDDLNDYSAMKFSGYTGAPKDAAEEILEIVNFISSKNGGEGAVREFIETILKQQGLWKNVINVYKNMK